MSRGFPDSPWTRALAVGVCFTLLAGCTGGGGASGPPSASAATRSNGEVAEEGRPAPDFALVDLEGQEVRLSDYAGQVVLLDFWATWCVPCREEIPMLNELHTTYGERGFTILAIAEEEVGAIREFVDENGAVYPNLVGTEEVTATYGVLGLPTGYLLDTEGMIVESYLGPKPEKILTGQIEALLEAGPAT